MAYLASMFSPSGAPEEYYQSIKTPSSIFECCFIVKNTFLDVVDSAEKGSCTAKTPRASSVPPLSLRRALADALEPLVTTKGMKSTPSTTAEASPRSRSPDSPHSGDMAPSDTDSNEGIRTALMVRNLPKNYTREMLLETLDNIGYEGKYNFVYLPIAFTSKQTFGYAMLSFVTHAVALSFMQAFDGFEDWLVDHDKSAQVEWSTAQQGLEQLLERYRNSPVVREDVPEELKPMYFVDGVRTDLPPPTKPLKSLRGRGAKRSGKKQEGKAACPEPEEVAASMEDTEE
jgi:hypothetical protein